MALVFSAYIYGIDAPGGNTEIAAAGGQQNGFPSGRVHMYPTSDVRGVAQVTCQTVIELLPEGLNQRSTKYYSATAIGTLITAANA